MNMEFKELMNILLKKFYRIIVIYIVYKTQNLINNLEIDFNILKIKLHKLLWIIKKNRININNTEISNLNNRIMEFQIMKKIMKCFSRWNNNINDNNRKCKNEIK